MGAQNKIRIIIIACISIGLLVVSGFFSSLEAKGTFSVFDVDAISGVRARFDVSIEREGVGAVVVPGRSIRVYTDYGGGGVISIHHHFFEVGAGQAPYPINEYEEALYGLREGTIAIIKSKNRNGSGKRIEILSVCRAGALSSILSCESLPRDEPSSDLKGCRDFGNDRCQQAVVTALGKPVASLTSYLVEYCILESQENCQKLMGFVAANSALVGEKNVRLAIDDMRPFSGISVEASAILLAKVVTQNLDAGEVTNTKQALVAAQSLAESLSPRTMNIVLDVIERGDEAAEFLVSIFVDGLTSQDDKEKNKFASLLTGSARPVPKAIEDALKERQRFDREIAEMKTFFENAPANSVVKRIPYEGLSQPGAPTDKELMTPLKSGYLPLAIYLGATGGGVELDNRAGKELINAKDVRGATLLFYFHDCLFLERFLQAHAGLVDFKIRNKNGKTALDLAKARADLALVRILSKAENGESL